MKPEQLVNGAKKNWSVVGKLLEGFDQSPVAESPRTRGTTRRWTKQWSRGVKVLYGESAEKQERVAEELGVEVDVKEDDYCCVRKS